MDGERLGDEATRQRFVDEVNRAANPQQFEELQVFRAQPAAARQAVVAMRQRLDKSITWSDVQWKAAKREEAQRQRIMVASARTAA